LGVSPDATTDQIREAYQAKIREVHPDHVAHLAPELQELAEQRTKEIGPSAMADAISVLTVSSIEPEQRTAILMLERRDSSMAQHRCDYCGRFFRPNPRAVEQKHCGRDTCRRAHERRRLRRWRSLHLEHKKRYAPQERAWAKGFPDYWKQRRRRNPEYAARDDRRRVEARKRAKLSANETMIRGLLVEKLRVLDEIEMSANETGLHRRMEAFEDCLRSTVAVALSANETGIGYGPGPGG